MKYHDYNTVSPCYPATAPRSLRQKPISSATTQKKPQQALVRKSPHKISTRHRQKGRIDKNKHPMEPQDLDEENMTMGIENISEEGTKPISRLLPYIPPMIPTDKVTNDPNSLKLEVFTPFLLEEVPIEGDLLAHILFFNMEDLDLGDHEKFPQLEPSKYLKEVYYEDESIKSLETIKCSADIECTVFLNILCVQHFRCNIINAICVR